MTRLKFFKFYSPDAERIQREFDEWVNEVNPNIISVTQASTSHGSDKYLYVTVTYRTNDGNGLLIETR